MMDPEASRSAHGPVLLSEARREFIAGLLATQLTLSASGTPTIADSQSKLSVAISRNLILRLGAEVAGERLSAGSSGSGFETSVAAFLDRVLPHLSGLRCGRFEVLRNSNIAIYEQYEHLQTLAAAMKSNPALKVVLGAEYVIKPDVVVRRWPEPDEVINLHELLVDSSVASHTPIRLVNNSKAILHASVSCKWTLRSDRAQNARSEALNLIRNRKGRLPHTVVVTAEPTPGRIASLALGTGDLDCVYHIALPELRAAIEELGYEDSLELLDTMIEGKRLRDISDLPLDLVV